MHTSFRFLTLIVSVLFFHTANAANDTAFLKVDPDHDLKLHERVDGFLKGSFRVRETIEFALDGSEAASNLERKFSSRNELVYLSPTQWRVRREIPYSQKVYEFGRQGGRILKFKASNQPLDTENTFKVPDSTWMEVLLSAQKLSENWSLVDPNLNLDYWIKELRSGHMKTQNVSGDQIKYEDLKDGNFKISFQGKLLHDGKTQVLVKGSWLLSDYNKISEKDLSVSLMK